MGPSAFPVNESLLYAPQLGVYQLVALYRFKKPARSVDLRREMQTDPDFMHAEDRSVVC